MNLLNIRRVGCALFLAAAGCLSSAPAFAVGTAANTQITNVATATYTDGGQTRSINSNAAILRVQELIGVGVVSNNAGNVPIGTPDTNQPLSFTVNNPGNGDEPYELSFTQQAGDQFDPTNVRIYLDTNGNGIYDAGVDTLYTLGVNNPTISPDQSLVVFLVSDIPGALTDGNLGSLQLRATAVTANPNGDPAGTVFGGAGTGGVDAVIGPSTASQTAAGTYVVSQITATLNKTQAVTNSFGNAEPIPGATITYTLVFNVTGNGTAGTAAIIDPIPANTTYVPGTLRLEGAVLSDAQDADAGRLNSTTTPSQIEVNLGNVTSPGTRTVSFQATIN